MTTGLQLAERGGQQALDHAQRVSNNMKGSRND